MTEMTIENAARWGRAVVTPVGRLDLCDRGDAPPPADRSVDQGFLAGLVQADQWRCLPASIRERFARPFAPGETHIFVGRVIETRLSAVGRVLASVGRLIGGPLPLDCSMGGAAHVAVVEDHAAGGQIWTRCYARPGRFAQVIRSVKQLAGPTGLQEYLGYGLIMRLRVHVEPATLVFTSAGYAIRVLGRELAFPDWLEPGRCEIRHRDEGDGRFTFSLSLAHPWLGELITQTAEFRDADVRHRAGATIAY